MITDSYSKMMSDIGMRSVLSNNEELSLLMREKRRHEVISSNSMMSNSSTDRERELNMYRSGSAPPTVEGSLNAVGGLLGGGGGGGLAGELGGISEDELRSDPAYISYYYANVNLNPRLPPPLLSKEDWRHAQRLQGSGGSGIGGSAIGDRRKVNRDEGSNSNSRSLFAGQLGFNGNKDENHGLAEWRKSHSGGEGSSAEWGGNGLIGLPGLGSGSRQKSIAEIFKDDMSQAASGSRHPSRPASRNTFDENIDPSESHFGLHQDLVSMEALNPHPMSSASHTYASALGGSLSRSTTPDPQLVARMASPRIPGAGGRVNPEHSDLAAAMAGMNLSKDGMVNQENEIDDQNMGIKHPYLSINTSQMPKGLYPNMNNPSFSAEAQGSPVNPHLRAGGSPHYQHMDSPNSPYSSYGLGGYMMNPASPSMMANQIGGPLYDNGLDSRAMGGGGFGLGPNILAAAAELQNLQYAAALNDPTMELLALQKAYLSGLLSPQKSQYGLPYLNKTTGLNHYYGNYPTSPLAGPLLPNSGSPVRHGERSLRFPSGMRGFAGSFDESFASSLLDEFKSNKTKCFELSEISGHVVEFSSDQYGSRFIQQKLETATLEEKNMVFHEIMPQALSLMTDVFGNYVIQKFFEHGTPSQIRELADQLDDHVLTLSLQMYGCRVIQKAIEVVDLDQQKKMVAELDGHVMRCVRDQNGNHVIQKCIECIPEDAIHFIISTFYDQVVTLSTHPYGCRVIQRVLEHCRDPKTQTLVMDEILKSVRMLAQDQYGNYVVQHVLEHGKPHERTSIIDQLIGQIVQMSQQKFASNVVEKCLTFGTPEERQILVTEMLGTTDENEPLQVMMKDQFANYVVQKVLETCDDRQLEMILNRIKVHLNALKKYTYGKHIVARVEKLVAAGERRIGILAGYAAAAAASSSMAA